MNNLADTVLDYFWFLNFSEEGEADLDLTVKLMEDLVYEIENQYTEDEKNALRFAAERRLASWLREPDEHGYTPRKLLKPEQKQFLDAIARGQFHGPE